LYDWPALYAGGVVMEADRRFSESGNRNYNIKKIRDNHREVARLIALGYNNVDAAEIIGCSPQTISNLRNNPLMQTLVDELSSKRDEDTMSITKRVLEAAPIAISLLEETTRETLKQLNEKAVDDKMHNQGVKSAVAILDHAHPKTTKSIGVVGHLKFSEIEKLKGTFQEAERNAGHNVIDNEEDV